MKSALVMDRGFDPVAERSPDAGMKSGTKRVTLPPFIPLTAVLLRALVMSTRSNVTRPTTS